MPVFLFTRRDEPKYDTVSQAVVRAPSVYAAMALWNRAHPKEPSNMFNIESVPSSGPQGIICVDVREG